VKRILVNPRDPKIKKDGQYIAIDTQFIEAQSPVLLKTNMNVNQYSTKFAVELGFEDILSGKTDSNHSFFMFEYTATSPQLQLHNDINVAFGYGMRIGIVVNNSSFTGAVNLSDLAAQTEIKKATATCTAFFYCLDPGIVDTLSLLLPTGADFNTSYIANIGSAVALIAESMIGATGELLPQYIVEIPTPDQLDYITGLSASYALHGMTKSKSFASEVSRLSDKLAAGSTQYYYDRVELLASASIYNGIMNGSYTEKPDSGQVADADDIYNLWPETN
jgi:hypothetical protein